MRLLLYLTMSGAIRLHDEKLKGDKGT